MAGRTKRKKPKAARKAARQAVAPSCAPVLLAEMLADAYAEYRRAKQAKDAEPSKSHVEAFHRARATITQLEREARAAGLTPGGKPKACVHARRR